MSAKNKKRLKGLSPMGPGNPPAEGDTGNLTHPSPKKKRPGSNMRKTGIGFGAKVLALFLLGGGVANAQSLSYEIGYFAPGVSPVSGAPIQIQPLITSACNVTATIPTTSPKPSNPNTMEWDDPVNIGKACRGTFDLAVLISQPVGLDYLAGLRAVDAIGTRSGWATAPFDLRRPVATPTGFRVR